MMACNDMSLANEALSKWKTQQPSAIRFRQPGATVYFAQLEFSHLYEGLKVIDELRNDATLLAVVSACDATTQRSFQSLADFLPGGAKRKEFEERVGRIRSNLAFHYDESGQLIERAIADRSARPGASVSSITRGESMHYWRFNVADDIVDSIVVRQIWQIPRGVDLREEIDKVADWVHYIVLAFVDFAGEFIWKYCEP
jgi:hypothetical protein